MWSPNEHIGGIIATWCLEMVHIWAILKEKAKLRNHSETLKASFPLTGILVDYTEIHSFFLRSI